MIKATAEIFWVDENAQISHRATTVAYKGWFAKLRHLLLQSVLHMVKIKQNAFENWDAFVQSQQQKAEIDEQSVKDAFFFDHGYSNWKHIPRKTWKRHSALLVERQKKMDSLQSTSAFTIGAEIVSTGEKLPVDETRISFQVKAIKTLPVWASAMNEMSMVENDLSSLRLMQFHTIPNITAEAA